eukprot:TRINITY_DN1227_c0_g1_i7.p1 TRINITY_DN1227_c0_g1~~TRINITY_DN1227_c0_g1_i7.p1  ORF type:complete len:506 (+),score=102.80 TRINITY_DN1227_c0_g1_i7:112-1518(+)
MAPLQFVIALLALSFVLFVDGASKEEWKSRSIYQVFTDRYSQTQNNTWGCSDLGNYCGGTLLGIINHLDYISAMGFDAIWISPVVTNTDGGYHGYWAKDFYGINYKFGSSADLHSLVSAAHSRGMFVMLDVVANHVGPVGYDFSGINPFNSGSHYHDCNGCPSSCNIEDFNNAYQTEHCRLAGLPDLNQDVSYVKQTLLQWITDLVQNYSIDGLRIDTVPEVPKSFWTDFQNSAGVFAIGEVFNGDTSYVAGFQGPLNSVLSYPMCFTLRDVFGSRYSMNNIQNRLQEYEKYFTDVSILGTFIDNHDLSRFLYSQKDQTLYKSSLTYVIMAEGIPIIYYGTEQGFNGGNDPANREPLWTTSFNQQASIFQHIKTVNDYRKKAQVWNYEQIQRYSDDSFYAFTRGYTFVALTNQGSSGSTTSRTITYHPYANGTKLCNLFYPTTDCMTVQDGKFTVYLYNGESKIYYPV